MNFGLATHRKNSWIPLRARTPGNVTEPSSSGAAHRGLASAPIRCCLASRAGCHAQPQPPSAARKASRRIHSMATAARAACATRKGGAARRAPTTGSTAAARVARRPRLREPGAQTRTGRACRVSPRPRYRNVCELHFTSHSLSFFFSHSSSRSHALCRIDLSFEAISRAL